MTDAERRQKTSAIGERILDDYIRQQGKIPYRPDADHAHPFDRLVASLDKRRICIVEVKTKPRRRAYDDTGINQTHYDDYQHITRTYNIPLFLAFIDFEVGEMYGNYWHELVKPRESTEFVILSDGQRFNVGPSYPWQQRDRYGRDIVYFPLSAMRRRLYILTEAERTELAALHTSGWVLADSETLPFQEVPR